MPEGQVAVVPVPSPAPFRIAGNPALGLASAPVTVVEFIDYQCPFCQDFARETFPQLKAHYIDTGKVRYVARDFPLPRHERAQPAAIAAACAGEQGRFWEMHDALLASYGKLREGDLATAAFRLGLDRGRFDACRAEPRHAARLDADFAAARALGVSGTPTFLVGASRGEVAQGQLLAGDETYAEFEKVLAKYLPPDL
jgi:protein-disulfide isomerase